MISLFFLSCLNVPSHLSKPRETMASPSAFPSQEIRLLTINVWSGLNYKGFFKMGESPHRPEKRYELLVSEIRRLSPDIVALQEANPLPHYAERLAKDLDCEVIYSVALGGIRFGSLGIPTNMREGQAILVKKPWTIEALGKKRLGGRGIATNWLCFHFGEITQAILGRVVIYGKPLYVYNTHFHEGPFKGTVLEEMFKRLAQEMTGKKVEEARKALEKNIERRKLEIANLMKFVEETLPPGKRAIILGDLNTTVGSGELEPLLADGKWVDSFGYKNPQEEGATWNPVQNPNYCPSEKVRDPYGTLHAYHESQPHRIDFILVNDQLPRNHILKSSVVLTPVDGLSPSDHYGVLTTLKWQ